VSAELLKGYRVVDVGDEVQAVGEFMRDASVERKLAVVSWALAFLGELNPVTRAGVVRAAGDVNAVVNGAVKR
jgi:hypothetical protein